MYFSEVRGQGAVLTFSLRELCFWSFELLFSAFESQMYQETRWIVLSELYCEFEVEDQATSSVQNMVFY
jgi:hypothetical protein